MDKPFRWAVMGPGRIAHDFARALAAVPGAELYAVGSRDIGRARAFAAQYGAKAAYGSYEALADDRNVDAFYIATPHTAHCENALMCLERGKPALVEKPMSINALFERRMAEAAQRRGVFLMEAMWSRFLPAARHTRELLSSGAIGEPHMLSADFSFSAEPKAESRLFDPGLAGGGLLDVGIYVMALASMVFGPKPEAAASFAHIGETGVDEHAALLLKYAGGGIASLTCGGHAAGCGEAHVMGTEGRITLSPFWRAESVLIARGGETEEKPFPFIANGYEYEIMEVMDCVRRGLNESPIMPLGESIAIMETMDGFRKSWGLEYPAER